jgi:hypothetical protein
MHDHEIGSNVQRVLIPQDLAAMALELAAIFFLPGESLGHR